MKVPNFKRISRADFPDAPDWLERALLPIQDQIDELTTALQGKLTLQDNFLAQVKEFKIKDNTITDIRIDGFRSKPRGILLLDRNLFDYHIAAFEVVNENLIRAKVAFTDESPLDEVTVRVAILGG